MARPDEPGLPKDAPSAWEQAWRGPLPVRDSATFEKVVALRATVLRSEPGLFDPERLAATMLRDDHDAHALHWIIAAEGAVVAAARLCIHQHKDELPHQKGYRHLIEGLADPIASFNRLIVHPDVRRQGLSRALTAVRIEAAREAGARSIIVEAAPKRIPGLGEFGFTALGHSLGEPADRVRFTLMKLDL